jgi:hypothetical protein
MTGGRLADALLAEHAAIFGYGPVGAHLDDATIAIATNAEAAHRIRRDALVLRISARGGTAPAAEPAYALPTPVTDRASALELAITLEERTASAWRLVLPETTGDDRALALDALVDCAIRTARARRAAGMTPVTVTLPGVPT